MTPPRAILDVDIIYSRVLHELMGRAATDARLFDLAWSEELLGEAIHALVDRKGVTREIAEAWAGHIRREFPNGRFTSDALATLGVEVTDPDEFLVAALDEQPTAFERILVAQAGTWGGGRPTEELLDALGRAGVGRFASDARALIGEEL